MSKNSQDYASQKFPKALETLPEGLRLIEFGEQLRATDWFYGPDNGEWKWVENTGQVWDGWEFHSTLVPHARKVCDHLVGLSWVSYGGYRTIYFGEKIGKFDERFNFCPYCGDKLKTE